MEEPIYAFPKAYSTGGHSEMTLRDYFAGQALTGLYADKHNADLIDTDFADIAYAQANAMMERRKDA